MGDFDALSREVRNFADARSWEQFHTPKNLAMALAAEAGELLAELQWLSDDQVQQAVTGGDPDLRSRVGDEVADVLIYLLRLADVCDLDPLAEARAKLARNENRYPVHLSRGSSAKYTDLARDPGEPE